MVHGQRASSAVGGIFPTGMNTAVYSRLMYQCYRFREIERRELIGKHPHAVVERPRVVDLFCGSGAATVGLSSAFEVLAAVDVDPQACLTYGANHAHVRLYERDITRLDPLQFLRDVPRARDLDLLVVCAPCQPFSNQNRHKGSGDERAELVLQAARFAAVLRPKVILFENVPGLVSAVGIHAKLARSLTRIGYHFGTPRRIDAAAFGVPQRRVRCVMFAALSRQAVESFAKAEFSAPRRTVADAIGHLPALKSGEADPTDPLHFARRHAPIALRRLAAIPHDGGSRNVLPAELRLRCHENQRGFPDVYGRMSWSDVAPTLTTGCTDVTRGRFGHPDQDRAISLREAALLQTFPRDYVFHGTNNRIAEQIGNAVPCTMIADMVPALLEALNAP